MKKAIEAGLFWLVIIAVSVLMAFTVTGGV